MSWIYAIQGGRNIAQKFAGMKVSEILKGKKGSIKQAQLPASSSSWE
ncbi:hypothetical protein QUA20_12600 [Microcoleus sp. Pol7_A1]